MFPMRLALGGALLLGASAVQGAEPATCPSRACPRLEIAGDAPAKTWGTFRGFADPAIARDPAVPGRIWLAYSWPHVVPGKDPDGKRVQLAAVENRLARSDDGGAHFRFDSALWPAVSAPDPEGSGQIGILSSETASLVTISEGSKVTWYSARLSYFLQARTGYNPKYATSWQVRIGAASSPQALATAEETVLGVSNTASAYRPAAQLDRLAGLPVQHCAMLNNPTLFAQGRNLYLVVECLAFVGTRLDFANSTVQVFATQPRGAPRSWKWRHAGRLAGDELARELGHLTIQQPDVSLARDGKAVFLITPADDDDPQEVGTVGAGCVAIELASIDPPVLARDAGRLRIRASVEGPGVGACTHDRASATGIVVVTQGRRGGRWTLNASGVRP